MVPGRMKIRVKCVVLLLAFIQPCEIRAQKQSAHSINLKGHPTRPFAGSLATRHCCAKHVTLIAHEHCTHNPIQVTLTNDVCVWLCLFD